jgi:hypothetical protein
MKPEPPPLPAPALLSGVNIEALLEKALDAKSAVEVLERLAAMRREMKAEAGKEAYDRALGDFQAECPTINKGTQIHDKNGKPRYRYAQLDAIVRDTKDLLRKHGFSYTLTAEVEDKWVTAVLKAKHQLGHSEESRFKVPIDPDSYMNAPQRFASALTFAKRYAFCNAFGILTGDVDDDAHASDPEHAAGQDRRPPPPRQPQRPPPAPPGPPAAPRVETKPIVATPENKARAIELLMPVAPNLLEFLKKTSPVAVLLPNETLDQWPLRFVPANKSQFEALQAALEKFMRGDPAQMPFRNTEPGRPPEPKKDKSQPALPLDDTTGKKEEPPEDEAWRAFPVPFGKSAGVTLGDLDKKKLYGFVMNFTVEKEYEGRPCAPEKIARDTKFREMLDAAGAHYKFTKKD